MTSYTLPSGRVLYREDFCSMLCRCGNPRCDSKASTIVAACHPRSGLEAQYCDGALTLRCKKCKMIVAHVGVGLEPESIEVVA